MTKTTIESGLLAIFKQILRPKMSSCVLIRCCCCVVREQIYIYNEMYEMWNEVGYSTNQPTSVCVKCVLLKMFDLFVKLIKKTFNSAIPLFHRLYIYRFTHKYKIFVFLESSFSSISLIKYQCEIHFDQGKISNFSCSFMESIHRILLKLFLILNNFVFHICENSCMMISIQ